MYLAEAKNEQEKKDLALIIEEVLKQRIQGVKNANGVFVAPTFPKLLYVLDEDNITEDSPYWYLTKLAAECTAKRMVPDYISAKVLRKMKGLPNEENVFPCMGCRSFLPDYVDPDTGKHKFYGRFNQGVVTLNLPYVALEAINAEDTSVSLLDRFWALMEKYTEICHKGLRWRHENLKGAKSDVSPIHWQFGSIARLKPGEKIDKYLFNDYSSISLGFAGLYECVLALTGKSHTDETAKPFALQIMQFLVDKCSQWRQEERIGYSVYSTPIESGTYKFAKALKKFPKIEDVNTHDYITNSYHVNVREKIDPFDKLTFEAPFQYLATGGYISYVECSSLSNNIPAVLEVMKHIYNTIGYAELNLKLDYCFDCGYNGEIEGVVKDGKHIWRCPNCGCEVQDKLSVIRRTCG